jgi:DNA-directed RNA polymerase subunit RPC12/RpoP
MLPMRDEFKCLLCGRKVAEINFSKFDEACHDCLAELGG